MAIFAKRHYEAIAQAVQEADSVIGAIKEDSDRADAHYGLRAVLREICRTFKRDNPAFDQDRFERACKPGANVKSRKAA